MSITFAVVGNPNVGKTTLFNALTGLSQVTGNYPGVTVERKVGRVGLNGSTAQLVDLPGTYSMAARSPDEMIVTDVLLGQQEGEQRIDAILAVVDATNLERNLYLVSQLKELGKPMVVAMNMCDLAESRQIKIDTDLLSRELGVPVVPVRAHKKIGVDGLVAALNCAVHDEMETSATKGPAFPKELDEAVDTLVAELESRRAALGRSVNRVEAFRILVDRGGYAEKRLLTQLPEDGASILERLRKNLTATGSLAAVEARSRYAWIREVVRAGVARPAERVVTHSDRIDYVLTHRVWGTLVFLGLMAVVFQSIFAWAAPFMDMIDAVFGAAGDLVGGYLPEGMLQSLIVDGVIAGVGSVVIFLPQILILSLFIALLEDCGYMSRAAFLMDKLLSRCGLSGQSFIPLLSSFACAIPGVMATRTIGNRRDRFATILVAPLMSCSARLPVYMIMITAFIPAQSLLGGVFNLRGLTLLSMYLLGIAVAVPVAWVLKKTILKGETPPFVLELPSYKVPQWGTVGRKVWQQGAHFLKRAGTIIFAITVIVWALAYFPHSKTITDDFAVQREAAASQFEGDALETALADLDNQENGAHLANSFFARMGRGIEPAVKPLGWDWRIGMAALASFPAREVIVATLGTIFYLGEEAEEESILAAIQNAKRADGSPLFNIPVALSVMVFFALCCQCGATLAVIRRETGSWRWPAITFGYMTTLAYVAALVVYQATSAMGWGA